MMLRIGIQDFVKIALMLAVQIAGSTSAWAVNDPIAYWGFNNIPPISTADTPANLGITSIDPTTGTGTLSLTNFNGKIDDFTGTGLNADTVNPPGSGNVSLSMLPGDSPGFPGNGGSIQFEFSMTGLTDFGLSYAAQSSGTGFNSTQWSYSTDGTDFTPFGDPIVPNVSVYSLTGPLVTSALDNAPSAFLRYTVDGATGATGSHRLDNVQLLHNAVAPDALNGPTLPQAGDAVFGLSVSSQANTLEIVRGPLSAGGGERFASPWQDQGFIQYVQFDNLGGTLHNVNGNLLGLNFSNGGVGEIYSFGTNGTIPLPAPQKIGNAGSGTTANPDPIGHTGIPNSSLTGLSVSPDNTKIAVVGPTLGAVIVYDYTAGDTMGAGASLEGGRTTPTDSGSRILATTSQGTTWLDNDTVLAFSSIGDLLEVDADLDGGETTLDSTLVKALITPSIGSNNSDIVYNPEVSPYVYAMYSGFSSFASPQSQTKLYVFDPVNNYDVVSTNGDNGVDISLSSQTGRDLALDKDGNLFIAAFDGTITYIPAAMALNPATMTDDSSIFWYQSAVNASGFTGLDIGLAPDTVPGDFDGNGMVDARDYVFWRENIGTQEAYDAWRGNFGFGTGSGSASGSTAVPEPTGLTLLLVGVIGLWYVRRLDR